MVGSCTFFGVSPITPHGLIMGGSGSCQTRQNHFGKGGFLQVLHCYSLHAKDIFHGYFAVRLDSSGDEPALLLEGFLHVSNIPTNNVCCLTDFATAP